MLVIVQIWDAQKQELAGRVGATSRRIASKVAEALHDGKTAKIVPKADICGALAGPIADSCTALEQVGFGPKSGLMQRSKGMLFDHLVGLREKRWGDGYRQS